MRMRVSAFEGSESAEVAWPDLPAVSEIARKARYERAPAVRRPDITRKRFGSYAIIPGGRDGNVVPIPEEIAGWPEDTGEGMVCVYRPGDGRDVMMLSVNYLMEKMRKGGHFSNPAKMRLIAGSTEMYRMEGGEVVLTPSGDGRVGAVHLELSPEEAENAERRLELRKLEECHMDNMLRINRSLKGRSPYRARVACAPATPRGTGYRNGGYRRLAR